MTMATDRQIAANRATPSSARDRRLPKASHACDLTPGSTGCPPILRLSTQSTQKRQPAAAMPGRRNFNPRRITPITHSTAPSPHHCECSSVRARLMAWLSSRRLAPGSTGSRSAGSKRRGWPRSCPNDPASSPSSLRTRWQGAELKIAGWEGLVGVLEDGEEWNAGHHSEALDLLGVPLHHRGVRTVLDARKGVDLNAHRTAIARREIARLRERIATSLEMRDELMQRQTIAALQVVLTKPAALVMRYESNARRWFERCLADAGRRPKFDKDRARPGDLDMPPPEVEEIEEVKVTPAPIAKPAEPPFNPTAADLIRAVEERTMYIERLLEHAEGLAAARQVDEAEAAAEAASLPQPTTPPACAPEPQAPSRRRGQSRRRA